MNAISSLATFYKDGGFFMHAILAAAVFVVAIVVERLIVIGPSAALNSRRLVDDLVRAIARGDLASARNLSRVSNAPAARVAQAILSQTGDDESRYQTAGDDAATLVLTPLSRRLSHLGLLANVSTLLGLLGTIFGLTTAFSAVGAADPTQRSAFLAAGISTALNTTAFGLIVAVPTLLIHGWLTGLVEGIASQVDETIIRVTQAMTKAQAGLGASHVTPMPAARAAAGAARPAAAQGGGQ